MMLRESELLSIIKDRFVRVETIDVQELLYWVQRNYNPEDVFSTTQLDKWAESEGYTKQTENE